MRSGPTTCRCGSLQPSLARAISVWWLIFQSATFFVVTKKKMRRGYLSVSHVLLGNVYDSLGRKDDAIRAFRNSLKHNEFYMHGTERTRVLFISSQSFKLGI
jgi:hypothetical protein